MATVDIAAVTETSRACWFKSDALHRLSHDSPIRIQTIEHIIMARHTVQYSSSIITCTSTRPGHRPFLIHTTQMDDTLLAEFQSTFLIGGEVLTTHGPHPHYTLYKQRGNGFGSQELRRKKFLEEQKTRRRNYADYARRVVEGDLLEEDDNMEEGAYDEVDQGAADDKPKSEKENGKQVRV